MPAQKVIDPRFDREKVMTEFFDRQLRPPAVVEQRHHSHFAMFRLALRAVQHHRRQHVVAVRKDVGLDLDDVANDALCRKAAVIHDRRNTFNDDAAASVKRSCRHELASCELHASGQRATCGDGVVQLEKKLPLPPQRKHVLVSRRLLFRAIEKLDDGRPRLSKMHRGQCAIVGN